MKQFCLNLLAIVVLMNAVFAEEIGQAWEFDTEGDFQGWETLYFFSDAKVTGGCLQATITGSFPGIKGPSFSLTASEYGFIEIRARVRDASSSRVLWTSSTAGSGFKSYSTVPDTGFHVYRIPLYNAAAWAGEITQINKLEWSIKNAGIGQNLMIDYIRIISIGAIPEIAAFKPLRTVCKQDQAFPFVAIIKNSGDRSADFDISLNLPPALSKVNGTDLSLSHTLLPDQRDTLSWTLLGTSVGTYVLTLSVDPGNENSMIDTLQLAIADQYWQQTEFFLSAWSPPGTNDDAYQIYKDANFNHVLSLYQPFEANYPRVEQFEFACQMHLGSLIGEHEYLRAPDNIKPADLTDEQLVVLDTPIETYRTRNNVKGYYLTDEPNALAFPNLGKVVQHIREKDPTRLSFINLFPTYANKDQLGTDTYDEHVEQFLDIVKPELLSYDHYHFFNGYDGSGYFGNLGIIRKWALRYDIPFCNIIQAVGYDVLNWRIPSHEEHRWLVYSSLAYGAKALIWFHWDHEWGVTGSVAYTQLAESIRKLNIEINHLGPELIPLRSCGVYHSDAEPSKPLALPADGIVVSTGGAGLVIGVFKDPNDADFLMIMNKSYENSVTAPIMLRSQLSSLAVFDADSGMYQIRDDYQVSEQGTTFDLTLLPGQGKLITFSGTPVSGLGKTGFRPDDYHLGQNYPNPFNPSTKINFTLPRSENVAIAVYNTLGQKLFTLLEKEMDRGLHQVAFDGTHLSSGMYFYSMQAGHFSDIKKMVFLK